MSSVALISSAHTLSCPLFDAFQISFFVILSLKGSDNTSNCSWFLSFTMSESLIKTSPIKSLDPSELSLTFQTSNFKSKSLFQTNFTVKWLTHLGFKLLSITSVSPTNYHLCNCVFDSLDLREHIGSETVKKSRSTRFIPSTNSCTSCP